MAALLSLLFACSEAPEAPASPAAVRLLAVLDADGDGKLAAGELSRLAHPSLAWKTYDSNGSGALEARELERLILEVTPLSDDHRGPPPPGTVAPGASGASPSPAAPARPPAPPPPGPR
jgi:hypothetical protein